MFVDSRKILSGSVIEATVCIIGSGPAGISLARELASKSIDVCLLESGGFELDAASQKLYDTPTSGEEYHLAGTRLRQFGGTSNAWCVNMLSDTRIGVRYTPIEPIDMEARKGVPHSGWPISHESLRPYFERAQLDCQAGPYTYQSQDWEDGFPAFDLDASRLASHVFQFGPRSAFHEDVKPELGASKHLHTYLFANVVEIETTPNAKAATGVRIATLEGNTFRVSARVVVVASGGVESTRLLLASNRVCPDGLGNHSNALGRYYMDHPLVDGGILKPANAGIFRKAGFYDMRHTKNTVVMGRLGLSEKTLRDEELMNISMMLFPQVPPEKKMAHESLHLLFSNIKKARLPAHAPRHIGKIVKHFGFLAASTYLRYKNGATATGFNLASGGWSQLDDRRLSRFDSFAVMHQTEQAPDPANRLTLTRETDALGMPKAHLHWQWGKNDIRSVQRAQYIMKTELARLGIGDFQIADDDDRPRLLYSGTHHHMGTTRMHVNPNWGVVDADCRVHGMHNLFVASSSVFPTGGFANPTLTVVALAVRMAEHIHSKLALNAFPNTDTIPV